MNTTLIVMLAVVFGAALGSVVVPTLSRAFAEHKAAAITRFENVVAGLRNRIDDLQKDADDARVRFTAEVEKATTAIKAERDKAVADATQAKATLASVLTFKPGTIVTTIGDITQIEDAPVPVPAAPVADPIPDPALSPQPGPQAPSPAPINVGMQSTA